MMNGQSVIIGIAGGSGAGKTIAAKLLCEKLGKRALILEQDRYYIDQRDKFDGDGGAVNYDHPSAIDFSLMAKQLMGLKRGESIEAPCYDFPTHRRMKETSSIRPHDFIVIDGILILSQEIIRECLDYSIYIDATEEYRFQRRAERDIKERGRSPHGVKKQIDNQVRPMHEQFVEASKQYADAIAENNGSLSKLSEQIDQIINGNNW